MLANMAKHRSDQDENVTKIDLQEGAVPRR